MPHFTWETVAAVTGEKAAFVAYMIAVIDGREREAHGPVSLQQLSFTPLYRLAIHRINGRIESVFSLPVDEAWTASYKEVKGKSTSRAVEVTINLTDGGLEGYEKLVLYLPFDGNDGNAILFAQACIHASKEAEKNVVAMLEGAMSEVACAPKMQQQQTLNFDTDSDDEDDAGW